MNAEHSGERTGEQAGALARVRDGAAGQGAGSPVLQVLQGDETVLAVPGGVVHAVLGPRAATERFIAGLTGSGGAAFAPRRRGRAGEGVLVDGKPVRLTSRSASSAGGIAIVTGGRAISWAQSVADNVLLGNERRASLRDGFARLLGRSPGPGTHLSDTRRAARALGLVGLERAQAAPVSGLTGVERRLLELARAVAAEASVIVVDDTGVAMGRSDRDRWRQAVVAVASTKRPDQDPPAVLLVTGSVTGLSTFAHAATVLAGTTSAPPTRTIDLTSFDDEAVVLSALAASFGVDGPGAALGPVDGAVASWDHDGLAVEDWIASHPADAERLVVNRLSFTCAPGEVLGLFGPLHSGAGEVLLSVFGRSYGARVGGTVRVDGEVVDVSTTDRARAAGVIYTTEHPMRYDLSFLGGVPSSVSPESLTRMVSTGLADPRRDYEATTVPGGLVAALPGAHRGPSAGQFTDSLRGLTRSDMSVVLLAEPFGDADDAAVGADRRALIRALAAGGRAVVVASADPAALAAVCDRVIAVRAGSRLGEVGRSEGGGHAPLSTLAVLRTMGGLA